MTPWADRKVRHHALYADPHERHRDQDLPAETHDLVIAVARKSRPEPEEKEQRAENLEPEPEEAWRPENRSADARVSGERAQPAAKEKHRGQRRDQDHVRVFSQKEQR